MTAGPGGSRDVHLVVPDGVDDLRRPSGGNAYDRRVRDGLAARGWAVHQHEVAGPWPAPDAVATARLAGVLAAVPDGALVVVDGLVASASATTVVPAAARLRLVVLLHLPLGDAPAGHVVPGARASEAAVLGAAAVVVTTSGWARQRLLRAYDLEADRVVEAAPGVDQAPLAPGTADGGRLLCVAPVTAHKGQDVLVEALARLDDHGWVCCLVGSLDRDPAYVDAVRARIDALGIRGRFTLTGVLTGDELAGASAGSDLLVLPSLGETYGLVVTEALARGLPVVASRVGGVPEALGRGGYSGAAGMLVPPGDPVALADALRAWLVDPDRRRTLRQAVAERRMSLTGWGETTRRFERALVAAGATAPAGSPGGSTP
jgi:glycosyltransferase involved in cell wall biosynthesis